MPQPRKLNDLQLIVLRVCLKNEDADYVRFPELPQ